MKRSEEWKMLADDLELKAHRTREAGALATAAAIMAVAASATGLQHILEVEEKRGDS